VDEGHERRSVRSDVREVSVVRKPASLFEAARSTQDGWGVGVDSSPFQLPLTDRLRAHAERCRQIRQSGRFSAREGMACHGYAACRSPSNRRQQNSFIRAAVGACLAMISAMCAGTSGGMSPVAHPAQTGCGRRSRPWSTRAPLRPKRPTSSPGAWKRSRRRGERNRVRRPRDRSAVRWRVQSRPGRAGRRRP
jgi:hypothetical protein